VVPHLRAQLFYVLRLWRTGMPAMHYCLHKSPILFEKTLRRKRYARRKTTDKAATSNYPRLMQVRDPKDVRFQSADDF